MLRTLFVRVSLSPAFVGLTVAQEACSANSHCASLEEASAALQTVQLREEISNNHVEHDEYVARFAIIEKQLSEVLATMDDSVANISQRQSMPDFEVLSTLQSLAEVTSAQGLQSQFREQFARRLAAIHRQFVLVALNRKFPKPHLLGPTHPLAEAFKGPSGSCWFESGVNDWQTKLKFAFVGKILIGTSTILNKLVVLREQDECQKHLDQNWNAGMKQYTQMHFTWHSTNLAALQTLVDLPVTKFFFMDGKDGVQEIQISRFPHHRKDLIPQSPLTLVLRHENGKNNLEGVRIGDEGALSLDELHTHAFLIALNSESSSRHLTWAHYQVGLIGAVTRNHVPEGSRLRPLLAIFLEGIDRLNEFTSVALTGGDGTVQKSLDIPLDVGAQVLGDECGEFSLAEAYQRGSRQASQYMSALEALVSHVLDTEGALEPGLKSSLRKYDVDFADLNEAQIIATLFYVGTFEHMLWTSILAPHAHMLGNLYTDGSWEMPLGDLELSAGVAFRANINQHCVQDNYDYLFAAGPQEDLDQFHVFQDQVNEFVADGNPAAWSKSDKCIWRSPMQ